jgi:hypothetical protein
MKRPEQVKRHRMLPHGHLDFGDRRILDDRSPCAIVKYIQLAETADRLLDRAPDALLFGDVVSTKAASPPESRTVASQARPNSGFNSAIAMLAPSRANKRAAARAIPDPDPVINATFPSRRPMICASFSHMIPIAGCCAGATRTFGILA